MVFFKIRCDGILHVIIFHYFKTPYIICKFFTKFIYNEYIGPYFLSHVVLRFSPVNPPRQEAILPLMLIHPLSKILPAEFNFTLWRSVSYRAWTNKGVATK